MEAWSLPPRAAGRLRHLEHELGETRIAGPDGALVRGSHWRNFLVKYPEANRAHKKMMALSALCRERGDPPAVRRAIGRAQCNDAYWHGVFGGLYLPHLRAAVWHHLALAERELRADEALAFEVRDFDGDGNDEVWIHSPACSVVVAPARGGAIEDLTLFASLINHTATLTRRREAYHDAGGHHLAEDAVHVDGHPPMDHEDRALFVDRVLPAGLAFEAYASGDYAPLASWARARMTFAVESAAGEVLVRLQPVGGHRNLLKEVAVGADGRVRVRYRLALEGPIAGGRFAPELSFGTPLELRLDPEVEPWRFPIETVAKSERGLEKTLQGISFTPVFPTGTEECTIEILPPPPAA
jgi:hypothetical protein